MLKPISVVRFPYILTVFPVSVCLRGKLAWQRVSFSSGRVWVANCSCNCYLSSLCNWTATRRNWTATGALCATELPLKLFVYLDCHSGALCNWTATQALCATELPVKLFAQLNCHSSSLCNWKATQAMCATELPPKLLFVQLNCQPNSVCNWTASQALCAIELQAQPFSTEQVGNM